MELQITTLIENMQDDGEMLLYEHGLSLYIEFEGKKILFDTGQTGDFVKNAEKLEKSLEEVDYVIISHGHYDHSGGVMSLAAHLQQTKPLYVGKEFFDKKYKLLSNGSYRYNGNFFTQEEMCNSKLDLHEVTEDVTYLGENILLFKNFKRYAEFERLNPNFFVVRSAVEKSKEERMEYADVTLRKELDDFRDEIALGLCTAKGLVLVVGCSHIGIVNILRTVKERVKVPIYSVLGGTHLIEADEERLAKTMQELRMCGLSQIAVSHCTGEAGMDRAEKEFGVNFVKNNTGNVYAV